VFFMLFASCAGAPPPPAPAPAPAPVAPLCEHWNDMPDDIGSDYAAPVIEGFAISPPVACPERPGPEHGSYIRIERTRGKRTLGTAKLPGGGFGGGCDKLPASADDCPVASWGPVLVSALNTMRDRGLEINGLGGGPCADVQGDYAAWNMSVGVTSWKQAAAAVTIVAAVLDRYDLAGYVGVAVKGVTCADPSVGAPASSPAR
jgi:hypothetical protein